MKLRENETVLVGNWIEVDGTVVGDEACNRIEQLIRSLDRIAVSDAGWTTLFRDAKDGRYWELTFPHGEWHGGGPPTMTCVSVELVRSKYGL
jgi:hypothetical protein